MARRMWSEIIGSASKVTGSVEVMASGLLDLRLGESNGSLELKKIAESDKTQVISFSAFNTQKCDPGSTVELMSASSN